MRVSDQCRKSGERKIRWVEADALNLPFASDQFQLVTSAFVEEATQTGIDIFRIFDALNNVEYASLQLGKDQEAKGVVDEITALAQNEKDP